MNLFKINMPVLILHGDANEEIQYEISIKLRGF